MSAPKTLRAREPAIAIHVVENRGEADLRMKQQIVPLYLLEGLALPYTIHLGGLVLIPQFLVAQPASCTCPALPLTASSHFLEHGFADESARFVFACQKVAISTRPPLVLAVPGGSSLSGDLIVGILDRWHAFVQVDRPIRRRLFVSLCETHVSWACYPLFGP